MTAKKKDQGASSVTPIASQTRAEPRQSRVWIELEHPHKVKLRGEEGKVFAEKQCELANAMLIRLNGGDRTGAREFFWSEHEVRYCYGGNMGYMSLRDNGEWFNLDHLGRPQDTLEQQVEHTFLALGRAGGNTTGNIYRAAWEALQTLIANLGTQPR